MKKYLILVKHSLPAVQENIPARDWHLAEEGTRRAERLADPLRLYAPEVLVSSIEPKARETAEIIGRAIGLDAEVVGGLHEHDRSHTPYLSKDEFQNAVQEFFLKPSELVFGSETADEAHDRFSNAINTILEVHENRNIVVVAHGTVISLFVSRLTGISAYSLWQELGLPGFVVLDMNSRTLISHENIP